MERSQSLADLVTETLLVWLIELLDFLFRAQDGTQGELNEDIRLSFITSVSGKFKYELPSANSILLKALSAAPSTRKQESSVSRRSHSPLTSNPSNLVALLTLPSLSLFMYVVNGIPLGRAHPVSNLPDGRSISSPDDLCQILISSSPAYSIGLGFTLLIEISYSLPSLEWALYHIPKLRDDLMPPSLLRSLPGAPLAHKIKKLSPSRYCSSHFRPLGLTFEYVLPVGNSLGSLATTESDELSLT